MDVVERAGPEQPVAERPFVDESEPLVHAPGSVVVGVDVEPDPLQAQLSEAEGEHRAEGIGAVALIRVGGVADHDPQARRAVDVVDVVEVDRANWPAVIGPADDEVPDVVPVVLEQPAEPAFLQRQAEWATQGQRSRRPIVVEPADEQRQVVAFRGPKEDGPVAHHRFDAGLTGLPIAHSAV